MRRGEGRAGTGILLIQSKWRLIGCWLPGIKLGGQNQNVNNNYIRYSVVVVVVGPAEIKLFDFISFYWWGGRWALICASNGNDTEILGQNCFVRRFCSVHGNSASVSSLAGDMR